MKRKIKEETYLSKLLKKQKEGYLVYEQIALIQQSTREANKRFINNSFKSDSFVYGEM